MVSEFRTGGQRHPSAEGLGGLVWAWPLWRLARTLKVSKDDWPSEDSAAGRVGRLTGRIC